MSKLLRLIRIPASDRKLLLKTVLLLWIVRLGLWILPFQRLQDLLRRKTQRAMAETATELASIRSITRGVIRMSRYVPAATCLTQSLVTVRLLDDFGLPGCLRIGVAKGKSGALEAHAWVESQGRVVIGGTHIDLKRFTVLQSVQGT